MRLLSGEKDIAVCDNGCQTCCIHQDAKTPQETSVHIRQAPSAMSDLGRVEAALAHNAQ
ncbi:hypothetical protein BKA56DRAFT_578540 [Ilyonectria sp. MPI-CAGE-AT-0026]|nr:hypothetical protein BKA56DRAFT_578540 [Ilyonectria sp. MPI-CAGE-AT-0026]